MAHCDPSSKHSNLFFSEIKVSIGTQSINMHHFEEIRGKFIFNQINNQNMCNTDETTSRPPPQEILSLEPLQVAFLMNYTIPMFNLYSFLGDFIQ